MPCGCRCVRNNVKHSNDRFILKAIHSEGMETKQTQETIDIPFTKNELIRINGLIQAIVPTFVNTAQKREFALIYEKIDENIKEHAFLEAAAEIIKRIDGESA